jgi:hypothetical protein
VGWIYKNRGLLMAVTLSLLGHLWVGLIWQAPVMPPKLWTLSNASELSSSVKIRWIRKEADAPTISQQATSAEASAQPSGAAPEQDMPQGLQLGKFVPSSKLDTPLVPMSAPDTSQLTGLHFSGQPIRLRLLVATNGRVAEVLILQAAPEDEDAITHVKAMFMDTAYIPAQLDGKPVAAQLDLELQLS